MSAFTALNLEPEDTVEQEVDDSREIQIEEALKLYQNALKLHSQGSAFVEAATDAYKALFQSEIFQYPEAASEFAKDQISGVDDNVSAVANEIVTFVPTSATDASPNSLLQIIYLAYKNYGQFILDNIRNEAAARDATDLKGPPIVAAGRKALQTFADALERDDSDLDLWRKAARVGSVLASHRVIRFCLESVLVTDEENSYDSSDLLGLDELSAFNDLRRELKLLEDDLSTSQVPTIDTKNTIAVALKNRMDPYPWLPPPAQELRYDDDRKRPYGLKPRRTNLTSTSRTWTGVGMSIYRILLDQQMSDVLGPGGAITIDVPAKQSAGSHKMDQQMDLDLMPQVSAEMDHLEQNMSMADGLEKFGKSKNDGPQYLHEDPANGSVHDSPDTIEEQVAAQLTNGIAETLEHSEDNVKPAETDGVGEAPITPAVALPTRKRTSTSAGLEEPNEGGRTKSKRLRARESIIDAVVQEEDIKTDLSKHHEDHLIELSQADDIVFTALEQMLDPLEVHEMSHIRHFRNINSDSAQGSAIEFVENDPIVQTMLDLQTALVSWTDEKGQAFLIADGTNDLDGMGSSRHVGLALFQEHTKPSLPQVGSATNSEDDEGLDSFVQTVNNEWSSPQSSAMQWFEALMLPNTSIRLKQFGAGKESSYKSAQWSPALKELVVNMIVLEDEHLTQKLNAKLLVLEERLLANLFAQHPKLTEEELGYVEMAQTLFELHLDVYCAITNPSSEVDKATRTKQKNRLFRWSDVASAFINHYARQAAVTVADDLAIRYLFAATLHAIKADDAVQEHIMICLRDLEHELEHIGDIKILLPNNAAMPEISVAAVRQEMSRLSTLDFFMAMFNNDDSDQVAVIESLEPLLDPTAFGSAAVAVDDKAHVGSEEHNGVQSQLSAQARELVRFLDQGSASFTLFLWRRLRDAYTAIEYPAKVVSCYLRSLEVVMNELVSPKYQDLPKEKRQITLLKWLRYLDELMIKLTSLIQSGKEGILEVIDADHLKDSLTAVMRLGSILHSFAAHEDAVRVGQIGNTAPKSASLNRAFEKVKDRLRDMQMRLWIVLYVLIRDGISQNQDSFPNALEDRINYLRFVHNAMGLRQYCRYANKTFLKLIRQEFIAMKSWQDYDADFAQVLYDLNGLRFGYGIGDQDHNCSPEPLEKKIASQIIPFVMGQVARINIKDLGKSELKGTLDKLQQVMGSYKTTRDLSFNKRIINQYLKSPIDPRELYSCLRGAGDLPAKPVRTDTAPIAETGWYFLQGQLALARFKSVKRVNPTATDDLDDAATFFRQDLDHSIDNWETWYGLAQVNDGKIDDDLLWTSDKINNQRGELATLQRHAIHCYAMAVSKSLTMAETTPEASEKISDMYTAFAIRLYSSSREPLSMQAFSLDNYERHYSAEDTQQMYKAKPFVEMKTYAVWNLAANLLRKALVDKPKKWINQYYLGKCLWKMFRNTGDPWTIRSKPGVEDVLEVLVEAVHNVPPRKDNRNDPILEPHFKLVSIVHKLVRSEMLDARRGSEVLQVSQWARKVHLSEEEDGWEPYVLQILKNLSHADKSNWHHRIPARAAHIIYDDNEKDLAAALGAKHEFTQQIFTKTMTLQVWKPENERPGRHFVYTTRYVSFFIGILYQLNDRPNLDQLARRIRRRPSDFMNHGKLWDAICTTYLQLLRKLGKIQQGLDQTVFGSMNQEDFAKKAAKVETWSRDPELSSSMIDILRDAIELKKLNNSLMKGTAFDDLIADAYTKAYELYYQDHPEAEMEAGQPGLHMSSFLTPATMGPLGQTDGAADSTQANNTSAFSAARSLLPAAAPADATSTAGTPENTATTGTAPSKPNRNRNVTRREMIRRAEALVSRPSTTQASALSKTPSQTPGKVFRPVVEIRSTSTPAATTNADNTPTRNGANGITSTSNTEAASSPKANEAAKISNTATSPAGSAAGGDDDGDDATGGNAADESGSELSDLDEDDEMDLERKASILFPGLMAARNREDSTSSNGDEGQESQDGDEENVDENGGDDDDVDLEEDNEEQRKEGHHVKDAETDDQDHFMEDVEKLVG